MESIRSKPPSEIATPKEKIDARKEIQECIGKISNIVINLNSNSYEEFKELSLLTSELDHLCTPLKQTELQLKNLDNIDLEMLEFLKIFQIIDYLKERYDFFIHFDRSNIPNSIIFDQRNQRTKNYEILVKAELSLLVAIRYMGYFVQNAVDQYEDIAHICLIKRYLSYYDSLPPIQNKDHYYISTKQSLQASLLFDVIHTPTELRFLLKDEECISLLACYLSHITSDNQNKKFICQKIMQHLLQLVLQPISYDTTSGTSIDSQLYNSFIRLIDKITGLGDKTHPYVQKWLNTQTRISTYYGHPLLHLVELYLTLNKTKIQGYERYTDYLEEVFGVFCYHRYPLEVLINLKELSKNSDPIILYFTSSNDHNNSAKTTLNAIRSLMNYGMIIPFEVSSILDFHRRMKYLNSTSHPKLILLYAHGNNDLVYLSNNKYGQITPLTLNTVLGKKIQDYLSQLQIPLVLISCTGSESNSSRVVNELHKNRINAIAPQSDCAGLAEITFQYGVPKVMYFNSRTTYPPTSSYLLIKAKQIFGF